MIIDFHTHIFPDSLAPRAIDKLSKSADIISYTDGTFHGLQDSMKQSGITYSVLLPVVTKPSQQEDVNRIAIQTNDSGFQTGIFSFGGIHPENENYRQILKHLASHGIKGIKLHPVFQGAYLDDIRYMRIIDYASSLGLCIMVHGGYDISFPSLDYVTPIHILPVLEDIHPDKLILAHMGGWHCWNDVARFLVGSDVYFDTSFSITPLRSPSLLSPSGSQNEYSEANTDSGLYADSALNTASGFAGDWQKDKLAPSHQQMSLIQFCNMVRNHGTDNILFGTDSPWASPAEALKLLSSSALSQTELADILYGNAAKLLGIGE